MIAIQFITWINTLTSLVGIHSNVPVAPMHANIIKCSNHYNFRVKKNFFYP